MCRIVQASPQSVLGDFPFLKRSLVPPQHPPSNLLGLWETLLTPSFLICLFGSCHRNGTKQQAIHLLLLLKMFWDRVSYVPDQSQTYYVDEDNWTSDPPVSICRVLGIKPRGLCLLTNTLPSELYPQSLGCCSRFSRLRETPVSLAVHRRLKHHSHLLVCSASDRPAAGESCCRSGLCRLSTC